MPVELIKEREHFFKSFIRDADAGVVPLDRVLIKDAAVQIRNGADKFGQFLAALLGTKAFMKKTAEEAAVEGVELVFADLILHSGQAAGEVVLVTIEKTFPLEKVAEHDAV